MSEVRFDQQRARDAVQALSDTAALLRAITNARVDMARRALAQWTGPHASQFRDRDLMRLTGEATAILGLLSALQSSIEAAQAQAASDLLKQHDSLLPGGKVLPD